MLLETKISSGGSRLSNWRFPASAFCVVIGMKWNRLRAEVARAIDVVDTELVLRRTPGRGVEDRPVHADVRRVVVQLVEHAEPALRLVRVGERRRRLWLAHRRGHTLVERFAQVRLVPRRTRVIHAPVDAAVRGVLEEVLAADGVGEQPFLDELQPVVLVFPLVVEIQALEEAPLVAAAVRVEVLEGLVAGWERTGTRGCRRCRVVPSEYRSGCEWDWCSRAFPAPEMR